MVFLRKEQLAKCTQVKERGDTSYSLHPALFLFDPALMCITFCTSAGKHPALYS